MGEQIADGPEVPQRLAHLLGVDVDESVVQPEAGQLLPAGRLALRDLVLVVGKDEILASSVHVEGRPQELLAHRRALDVPAWPAGAPRAVPGDGGGLSGLGGLTEGEIARVALLLARLHARARARSAGRSAPASRGHVRWPSAPHPPGGC